MKLKYIFILLLLFNGLAVFPQDADEINNRAAAVLLTLSQDKVFPEKEFNELKNLILPYDNGDNPVMKVPVDVSSFDSLKSHLRKYETENKSINSDSSLVLFTDWYLHLQRVFYNYNKQNFFNSTKTKVLFFTTSVSCHCTMEMCRKQLVDILELRDTSEAAYSFLIVDSYWNNDLQLKYETYFAPAVLIFSSSNEMISLIEYDEKMAEKLNDTLNKL